MTSTSTRRGAAHPDPEVLIVGAGPTGLTLANELARYGVAFRIVDKAPFVSQHAKALGVQARTLELIERLGSPARWSATACRSPPSTSSASCARSRASTSAASLAATPTC